MSEFIGVEPKFKAPPECQKVNGRRIKRAISKFLKALHHEVKGGLHVAIGYEIPIIDDGKGGPQIVKGTEYYRPAEKSTKGKKRPR